MDTKLLIKGVTGAFVLPIAISAHRMWPWWTKATMKKRIATGAFILPIVYLASLLTPWWESL